MQCLIMQQSSTSPATPSPIPTDPSPALKICEEYVCTADFQTRCVTLLPESLCWPCPHLYTSSTNLCKAPSCFKYSTFILILKKKPSISGSNNYKPDICDHEFLWETGVDPLGGHHRPPSGPVVPTRQTGQWMMQSTWDCTTSCNTSTPQGRMQGSHLWTTKLFLQPPSVGGS